MAKKAEQEGPPGIPQAPKRKVIDAIEDLCVEKDGLCDQRTGLSQEIGGKDEEIMAKMAELSVDEYTYQRRDGVLYVYSLKSKLKKRKSELNPKKERAKKSEAA
jgi:hypothetical protein